jgi:ribokinase
MMKVVNFGSMNIDYVYQVEHLIQPGETLNSLSLEKHCGGKGLNQSIALAKAGAKVYHAGMIGLGGEILKEALSATGVDLTYLYECGKPAGHAIIQVNREGQNCILLYSGSNYAFQKTDIDAVLKGFDGDDLVILQNEINEIPYIMRRAHQKGLKIAFNPSPISAQLADYPLETVNWFILNEIEGEALTGKEKPDEIVNELLGRYPSAAIILTLGQKGVLYQDRIRTESFGVYQVDTVDTTAAGDTFTGYFLAGIVKGMDTGNILKWASAAAALAVSQKGAADSIPSWYETGRFMEKPI